MGLPSNRQIHRVLSFYGGACFFLTALTGVAYALLSEMGLKMKLLLRVHQASIVGLKQVYAPALGLFVVVQAVTGAVLSWRRVRGFGWPRAVQVTSIRSGHAVISLLVGGLLSVLFAVSGGLYRVCKWLGWKETAYWWLELHVGKSIVGSSWYWPWYPIVTGLLVMGVILSGLYITPECRKLVNKLKR